MPKPRQPALVAISPRALGDSVEMARLRDFVDTARGWFWESDSHLRLSFVCGQYQEITGESQDDLLGCTLTELLKDFAGPDDLIRPHIDKLHQQRAYQRFNYQWRRSDGRRMNLRSSGRPYFDETGKFLGYRGVEFEAGKEQEAERRAHEAHEILMQAIDNMADGFVLFDNNDRFVLCNRRYREIYPEIEDLLVSGTSLKEIIRTYAYRASVYTEDEARDRFYLDRMTAWFRGRSMEVVTPAGRWIETRDQSTLSGDRVGIRIDVTERRQAEIALRESEARYRTLVENAPEAIVVLDAEQQKFVDANKNALELFRTDRKSLLSAGPADLSPRQQPDGKNSAESARTYIQQALDGKTPTFEWMHQDLNGEQIPCEIRLVRLPHSGRALLRGSITNISDRLRAEQALMEKTSQLQATLENMAQGISMFDADLKLVAFNSRFLQLLEFPPDLVQQGDSLEALLRFNAERGEYGPGDIESQVHERMELARRFEPHCFRRTRPDGTVLEIRGNPLPEGDGFVTTYTDVTEAHELSEKITHQATHDALTGLVNRWEFERRLERVIETACREGSRHALCYLDLDQFKVINDTCGHAAGDALLRQLGVLLPDRVRTRDTLARLGGDEFGVLMEHCSLENAQRVANTLRREVEGLQFAWEEARFRLGVSIGVVPIGPATESADEVLKAADAAVYAAKDRGRNRVHVYHAGDDELNRRHGEMQWVTRINSAMDENRLRLFYQRIVPLDEIIGPPEDKQGDMSATDLHFELLLRMEDEQGKIVHPATFLPAAERYNLAKELDLWVINEAFEWLNGQSSELPRVRLCSINLSGASLGNERLMGVVLEHLADGKTRGDQLCFEITETAAIGHFAGAKRFIDTLTAEGCRFALDDFGSGLSSFGYLKTLPVQFLKIDGAFVRDIHKEPIDLAMVKSINDIGHIMGKQTIAEFVENQEVLNRVCELGVDFVQGYALGRPEPVATLFGQREGQS